MKGCHIDTPIYIMYSVTGYKNTGFNLQNLPGTKALLLGMPSIALDTTDVMQQDFLDSLVVYANWETICDVDYIAISDACYIVTGIAMSSPDVAVLSLQYDALTSLGGAEIVGTSALPILDGYTERVCVDDDTYGKHTAPESFTPSQPLQLVEGALLGDDGTGTDAKVFVMSTVDLTDGGKTAITYTDSSTETAATVTIPSLKNAGGDQIYYMKLPDGTTKTSITPGTRLYDGTNSDVRANIQRARECGLDAGVLGQYAIPAAYVSTQETTGGEITNIQSVPVSGSSGLPFAYAAVKNQKTLCGELSKYLLVSMGSGDSAEYKPEDIQDGNAAPVFVIFSDPRYQQKPYCRPAKYLGDGSNLYLQALPGMPWADAPLRYTGASGSQVDKIAYESEVIGRANENFYNLSEKTLGKAGGGAVSMIKGLVGSASRWLTAGYITDGGVFTENQQAADYYSRGDIDRMRTAQETAATAANLGYMRGQYVAPTVVFPRSDTMRDFFGNGFRVYRYRLSDIDVARYDEYLTMYGYSEVKPLEAKDFTCRQYFNFVSCGSVTLGGSAPRWKREAAAQQLRAGVRVWHTAPDTTTYVTGNPIKT